MSLRFIVLTQLVLHVAISTRDPGCISHQQLDLCLQELISQLVSTTVTNQSPHKAVRLLVYVGASAAALRQPHPLPSIMAELAPQRSDIDTLTSCKCNDAPHHREKGVDDSKPKPNRRYKQPTLNNYFKSSSSSAGSSRTHAVVSEAKEIAQNLHIHLYTNEEIQGAKGLQKEFRLFWNEKAEELCKDPSIRMGRLENSSTAIQGAIYASWTLHKCSLLLLRAEKLQSDLKSVYKDETTLTDVLSAVKRNVDRMKTAHAAVTQIYNTTSAAVDDLNDGMHELRKVQDALSKAIDRRQVDINVTVCEQEATFLRADPPEHLSQDEVEQIVITIKQETENINFEELKN